MEPERTRFRPYVGREDDDGDSGEKSPRVLRYATMESYLQSLENPCPPILGLIGPEKTVEIVSPIEDPPLIQSPYGAGHVHSAIVRDDAPIEYSFDILGRLDLDGCLQRTFPKRRSGDRISAYIRDLIHGGVHIIKGPSTGPLAVSDGVLTLGEVYQGAGFEHVRSILDPRAENPIDTSPGGFESKYFRATIVSEGRSRNLLIRRVG
jgi:hypothetical protein